MIFLAQWLFKQTGGVEPWGFTSSVGWLVGGGDLLSLVYSRTSVGARNGDQPQMLILLWACQLSTMVVDFGSGLLKQTDDVNPDILGSGVVKIMLLMTFDQFLT